MTMPATRTATKVDVKRSRHTTATSTVASASHSTRRKSATLR